MGEVEMFLYEHHCEECCETFYTSSEFKHPPNCPNCTLDDDVESLGRQLVKFLTQAEEVRDE